MASNDIHGSHLLFLVKQTGLVVFEINFLLTIDCFMPLHFLASSPWYIL